MGRKAVALIDGDAFVIGEVIQVTTKVLWTINAIADFVHDF